MARMKDHLMQIENYVVDAYRCGSRTERDIISYVKERMSASDSDIEATIQDIFLLIDFVGSLHATSH